MRLSSYPKTAEPQIYVIENENIEKITIMLIKTTRSTLVMYSLFLCYIFKFRSSIYLLYLYIFCKQTYSNKILGLTCNLIKIIRNCKILPFKTLRFQEGKIFLRGFFKLFKSSFLL